MKPILGFQFILCLFVSSLFADEIPPEITRITCELLKGQHFFIAFENIKTKIGFNQSTKMSDVKAATPFQAYYIKSNYLNKNTASMPVNAIITPQEKWIVPLMIDNHIVCMFIITKIKGVWQAANIGSQGFAQEWDQITSVWSIKKGYHPKPVYANEAVFFYIPEYSNNNLTTITPPENDKAFQYKKAGKYNALTSSETTLKVLLSNADNSKIGDKNE